MKTYEVKRHYSSFCTFEISAENEEQAIIQARGLEGNKDEILSNLENWEAADEAFEIEDRENQ